MASFMTDAIWEIEYPIRMLSIKIAIRAHHLGLDPKAKIHPHIINLLDQVLKPVWKLIPVNYPVTESSMIIVSSFKPSIINHKKLYTQFFSHPGQCQLLLLVHIERGGIPAVV